MSGTFPSSPAPRELDIDSITRTLVSTSQSLKRQARSKGAHRWLLRLHFPPMTRDQWAPIYAFALKQEGQFETFQYVLPRPLYTPRGAATGSPVVNNQGGSPEELQTGSKNVVTSGWTGGVTNILRQMDFLTFAGHSKVYAAVDDVNSDGGGGATIPIRPGLYEGPAHGAAIRVNNVQFTVAFTTDTLRFMQRLRPTYSVQEIQLVEVY